MYFDPDLLVGEREMFVPGKDWYEVTSKKNPFSINIVEHVTRNDALTCSCGAGEADWCSHKLIVFDAIWQARDALEYQDIKDYAFGRY